MEKIWLLTYEINEYDQAGEYFLAAFSSKPTIADLDRKINGVRLEYLHHVYCGGGRQNNEDTWYHLREYKLL